MFAYRPRKQDATFRTHGSDNWRTMEAMGNEYGFRNNIDPVEGDRDLTFVQIVLFLNT